MSARESSIASWGLDARLACRVFHGFRRFVSELDADSARRSARWNCPYVVVETVGMAHMCRILFAILLMALTLIASSNSHAAGSFQKPPVREVVTAGVAPALPSISMPNVSASDLVGGCGRGKFRDPQTHGCRGPADIR